MAVQHRRDTSPELAVRRLLHAAGLRYRVAYPVPGLPRRTIDIAFRRARLAVFVDGCFWHGCPEHGTAPSANPDWWKTKIGTNQQRDAHTTRHLESQGWTVLRLWEHEPPDAAAARIFGLLDRRAPTQGSQVTSTPRQSSGHGRKAPAHGSTAAT
jgi:DNA mismatch endonuclease (patch repair protein)